MKLFNFKTLRLTTLCLSLVYFASCEKALDINRNPNEAPTATPALILPAAQIEMALPLSANWDYVGSMWAQYWTGGHGVSSTQLEFYTMQSVDVEASWTKAYARCLVDINYLTKSGQPVYSGMGKIMSAYFYQMLTDLFGDVPFSEAVKGAIEDGGILTPKFDSPEDIYAALIPLLDEGIAEIQESGPGIDQPGADDLYFEGNISKWIKFANTVKLKVLIRSGNYASARTLVDGGGPFISSLSDNAQVTWQETAKNTNPIWARFLSRVGVDMYYVGTEASVTRMTALDDPRIDFFYTKPSRPVANSPHKGVRSGDINEDDEYINLEPTQSAVNRRANFSNANPIVFGPTVPTIFVSAWESKFLQAEALIRTGGDGTSLFEDGVQASFDFLGAGDASAYTAALAFGGSTDNQLNILGIQKWISMNSLQMTEGWLETLRFDRAGNLIFTDGVSNGAVFTSPILNSLGENNFPTSFVYPTQEISLNPNTPANRQVTDRRFWDNN
jgi:hypothetical protein